MKFNRIYEQSIRRPEQIVPVEALSEWLYWYSSTADAAEEGPLTNEDLSIIAELMVTALNSPSLDRPLQEAAMDICGPVLEDLGLNGDYAAFDQIEHLLDHAFALAYGVHRQAGAL
jgi:hypothetical protein